MPSLNSSMQPSSTQEKKKDIALEGIRGIAAISVLLWHCALGFFPEHVGVAPHEGISIWQGSPFFFFINGTAAVSLFFVLSGYILTRRYFLSGDTQMLMQGALKRWPRLMGPVLVTVLISYLFLKLGWYFFEKAVPISHAPFLAKFIWNSEKPFSFSFFGALLQGSFSTFFKGEAFYNSSLWTMQPELLGSFIAFGLAPLLFKAKKISPLIVIILTGYVILLLHFFQSELVAFPMGVTMAALLPHKKKYSVNFMTIGFLVLGLYLLSTSWKRIGIYLPLSWIDPNYKLVTYFYILGATIVIALIEIVPTWNTFLSGGFFKWLGEFSFPIYLIHVVVISSLGCLVYLHYGALAATAVSLMVTPLAALPLLIFNRLWVATVNSITRQVLKKNPEINALSHKPSRLK